MKEFKINLEKVYLKVLFAEAVDGYLIKYNGRVYQLKYGSIQQTEEDLQFTFSFSRIAMNWNTILDFELDTKYADIAEMKEAIQDVIVTGIKGYDKGEKFDYAHPGKG